MSTTKDMGGPAFADTVFLNEDGVEVNEHGNPLDGDSMPYCQFPDCGCDGSRLCMAKSGANGLACWMNFERGTFK